MDVSGAFNIDIVSLSYTEIIFFAFTPFSKLMEATPENLQALATYLTHTLSPQYEIRKQAEDYLESVEGTQNYAILLLQLAESQDVESHIRLAASITFKNFVKRNWRVVEEKPNKIVEVDRELIKKHIVNLMLKAPEGIQKQLSDAITIIGREDFPNKWSGLIGEMVEKFKSGDFHAINGVLRTAHSLTKRYRYEFKSQELWSEIKIVLESFATPFSELLVSTMQVTAANAENKEALKVLFSSLLLICKIFYSLTYQELPDHFAEELLKPWMEHLHSLLVTDNKLLDTDDDEEAGPLELIKSQICAIAAMFAQKYDEDFSDYLPNFVQSVWNLLVTTDAKPKHDLLVSTAIEFLASVIERPTYKHLFQDEATLRNVCENVIIPNMQFRESDEELFEDNPEEYIRRDLEGSDVGTRRYSATNLVRGLCKYFEQPVSQILTAYVVAMLQEYQSNPEKNWKSKDTALYLISALAGRSKTTKHGITQTSDFVNVVDVYNAQCLTELQAGDLSKQPVLRSDAIRYLTTFRSVLPREVFLTALPLLITHLTSSSVVVHTYAAHCIEKVLILKTRDAPVMTQEDILPVFESLLTNLLNCHRMQGSEENEYVMKAMMRSLSTMKEKVVPYSATLMAELTTKLAVVSQNPSKPHFNHYLFESICCIIRYSCKVSPDLSSKFEGALFPIVENIFVRDVSEFLPYVFQLLSLLLEVRPLPVPPAYMTIYPYLLAPALWERSGNVPALVRLLQAFVEKASSDLPMGEKLMNLLGVFQKLIASKSNDHEGFYLLGSLVEHISPEVLMPHYKDIFVLLFQRLQSSKTTKYAKGLIIFLCLFAGKRSGPLLIKIVDGIQPKLFRMVLEKVLIPDVQKVTGQTERKICAIGITKLLTETPDMLTNGYIDLWVPLLQALISLFELPEDDSTPDDEHFIDIEDAPGYQTAYSQLMMVGSKDYDPFGPVVPKTNLAQSLHKLSSQMPGKLPGMITSGLSGEAAAFLQSYLQQANISSLL